MQMSVGCGSKFLPLSYEISTVNHSAKLGVRSRNESSSDFSRCVFDGFVRCGLKGRPFSLFVRNVVFHEGNCCEVVSICVKGFEKRRFHFVCISRNVETLERNCFSVSEIEFVSFEFESHLWNIENDCFAFMRPLRSFSIPILSDSRSIRDPNYHLNFQSGFVMKQLVTKFSIAENFFWENGETTRSE
jgi:hypothetical protein